MTDNADHRFDYGEGVPHRKRGVEAAHALVAAHVGDARVERLAMLCAEVVERLRTLPRPIMDHLGRLEQVVAAERDVVAELKQIEPLFETVPAAVDEEPPL